MMIENRVVFWFLSGMMIERAYLENIIHKILAVGARATHRDERKVDMKRCKK